MYAFIYLKNDKYNFIDLLCGSGLIWVAVALPCNFPRSFVCVSFLGLLSYFLKKKVNKLVSIG